MSAVACSVRPLFDLVMKIFGEATVATTANAVQKSLDWLLYSGCPSVMFKGSLATATTTSDF